MVKERAGGLHHRVLARVGADLTHGRVVAGEVMSMEQIEERYGVSRTVVREVVKVLESVGVATSRRRVGVTFQPESSWEALSPVIIQW
uniref:GntR family transcriptional regulator n=1 Tax=Raoultella terrigena TaxID=577 RepID=UPI00132FA1C9